MQPVNSSSQVSSSVGSTDPEHNEIEAEVTTATRSIFDVLGNLPYNPNRHASDPWNDPFNDYGVMPRAPITATQTQSQSSVQKSSTQNRGQ